MKKFYVEKKELNDEELRTGRVSYGRIVDRYIKDLLLCNSIESVDENIWDNVEIDGELGDYEEIYQWYLCDLDDYVKEQLIEWGFIFSYSNMLDLDVLMVNHWGTSWDYVMTDVEWSENFDEIDK